MLKIRMQRIGRINQPSYRIVVIEHARSTKAGKFVERVGSYDPKTKSRVLETERVKYWLSVGAQPSATVHNMLVSLGVLNTKKINVLPAYKAPEKPAEEAVAQQPAAAAPEAAATEEKTEEVPAETAAQ